jgi:hypothetical protein
MDISGCGRFEKCKKCTCKPTVKPKPKPTEGKNPMNKTLAAVLMAIYLSLVSMSVFADMTRVSKEPPVQVTP